MSLKTGVFLISLKSLFIKYFLPQILRFCSYINFDFTAYSFHCKYSKDAKHLSLIFNISIIDGRLCGNSKAFLISFE